MQNKTHVSLIVDKSGSMSSVREKTISGINEYFQTLKNDTESDYTVDLVFFDTSHKDIYRGRALKEVKPITSEDYVPNDGTALYDAVCNTLLNNEIGGGKWIVVIVTDGEENASRTFAEKDFSQMVKILKGTGNVQFVFLGANQDAFAKAKAWNIPQNNVVNFHATARGVDNAFNVMAANTVASTHADWAAQGGGGTAAFYSKAQQDDSEKTK